LGAYPLAGGCIGGAGSLWVESDRCNRVARRRQRQPHQLLPGTQVKYACGPVLSTSQLKLDIQSRLASSMPWKPRQRRTRSWGFSPRSRRSAAKPKWRSTARHQCGPSTGLLGSPSFSHLLLTLERVEISYSSLLTSAILHPPRKPSGVSCELLVCAIMCAKGTSTEECRNRWNPRRRPAAARRREARAQKIAHH
jgi:hypothetical protein